VGLGHADGQVAETLLGVSVDFGLGLVGHLDAVGPVDLAGNRLDLGLDGEVQVVQEFEVGGLAACGLNSQAEVLRSLSTFGPVAAQNCVKGSSPSCQRLNHFQFVEGVGVEGVDGDNDRDAELPSIGDLLLQVAEPLPDQLQVFLLVDGVQRSARGHRRTATVHLQCTDRGNQHAGIGCQS